MPRKSTKGKAGKNTFSKNNNYTLQVPSDTKFLIIHESPKEAKLGNQYKDKIEKELGGTTVITASIGHFYTTSNKNLDIDEDKWELRWKVDSSKKNVVANIKKAYEVVKKNKGKVIIATDPDREGEVIAYSIYKVLGLKKGQFLRMRPRDMSEKGYIQALKNLENDLDWKLVNAGIARQILDKWIGFKKTEILWDTARQYRQYKDKIKNKINNFLNSFQEKYGALIEKNKSLQNIIDKYSKIDWDKLDDFKNRLGISIGRVQTPTLRLLVEKDLEKFEKKLENKLNLFLIDKQKNKWEYEKNKQYETEPEKIQKVYRILNKVIKDNNIKEVEIVDIQTKKQKVNPPTPIDTQKAQSGINSMFGYSVKKIMQILQENYQDGYSTYMRTDSIDIPTNYKDIIKQTIKLNEIKAKYVDRDYKSKNAQEGHHAILFTKPFKLNNLPGSGDNKKILEYVVRRSIASLLEPAEVEYITYVIEIKFDWKGKNKKVRFLLKDNRIVKEGFLEVYIYQKKNYEQKYNFKKGDKVKIDKLELKEKEIKLPGTYTQGKLVSELEKLGIGRPSTWAGIVDTLLGKGYIKEEGGKLVITEKGYWVYETIKQNLDKFGKIFDLGFTAEMEKWLDEIATGERNKDEVIDEVVENI